MNIEGFNLSYCNDIVVGDLVCIKSHNVDDFGNGWLMANVDTGIVLEIIEIEHEFVFYDHKIRCYDYVIYWTRTKTIEQIPDIIVEKYTDWERRING
tara:strand:- start:190 stop:480 length:291 start_codon:yes stop_codon:yes gene_type:complete